MKKIVLLSDQIKDKIEIDKIWLNQFFTNRVPTIAYIPSCSDSPGYPWYAKKKAWYEQFGVKDLFYFDLDLEFDSNKITKLLSHDVIHLSGGNTFYFLNSIKKRNFIPILEKYISNGGVIVGVSAGAIVMSKDIAIANFGDQNEIGLQDLSALNFCNFDFHPHFDKNNLELIDKLKNYSITNQSIIYACQDGDGIIIDENSIEFFGEILKIDQGVVSNPQSKLI